VVLNLQDHCQSALPAIQNSAVAVCLDMRHVMSAQMAVLVPQIVALLLKLETE
jgi:hypothetical protein